MKPGVHILAAEPGRGQMLKAVSGCAWVWESQCVGWVVAYLGAMGAALLNRGNKPPDACLLLPGPSPGWSQPWRWGWSHAFGCVIAFAGCMHRAGYGLSASPGSCWSLAGPVAWQQAWAAPTSPGGELDPSLRHAGASLVSADEESPEENGAPGLLFKMTANFMFLTWQGVGSLQ